VNPIKTDEYSAHLRAKAVDPHNRRVLIARLSGSEQEKDLKEPPNCSGYGRVRHFRRGAFPNWPMNPLPIDPALKALQRPGADSIEAQVFQNAACNWRCWYCFVPFELLTAHPLAGGWLSADDLVDLYLAEAKQLPLIDLTGGQPDLAPEWVPWMMEALIERGLDKKTYLWSDDNLSNDYFWRYLTVAQIDLIRSYKSYGKVCCFKGFDEQSFSLNTRAAPELFARQFELFGRFLDLGIDVYGYITITSQSQEREIANAMPRFFDALQRLHENLPLRVVPLKIAMFGPVLKRLDESLKTALAGQDIAIRYWERERQRRFSASQLSAPITSIGLGAM
jgi:uncharacterized Fe-S cluster-containing radical SAM superfamily protein